MNPKTFIKLCKEAQVIQIDDGPLLSSVQTDDTDLEDSDSEIMYVEWTDADGNQCYDKFTVQGVKEAKPVLLEPNAVLLWNSEGDDTKISFFKLSPIQLTDYIKSVE